MSSSSRNIEGKKKNSNDSSPQTSKDESYRAKILKNSLQKIFINHGLYLIKASMASSSRKRWRKIHKILFEPKPYLQHTWWLKKILQRFPKIGKLQREKIHQKHLRFSLQFRLPASYLEKRHGRKLRGRVAIFVQVKRLPFGVKSDDRRVSEGFY